MRFAIALDGDALPTDRNDAFCQGSADCCP